MRQQLQRRLAVVALGQVRVHNVAPVARIAQYVEAHAERHERQDARPQRDVAALGAPEQRAPRDAVHTVSAHGAAVDAARLAHRDNGLLKECVLLQQLDAVLGAASALQQRRRGGHVPVRDKRAHGVVRAAEALIHARCAPKLPRHA